MKEKGGYFAQARRATIRPEKKRHAGVGMTAPGRPRREGEADPFGRGKKGEKLA